MSSAQDKIDVFITMIAGLVAAISASGPAIFCFFQGQVQHRMLAVSVSKILGCSFVNV
jgi:hypothetical protein